MPLLASTVSANVDALSSVLWGASVLLIVEA
jgi:hypothetical protein